eukprot:g221.t1
MQQEEKVVVAVRYKANKGKRRIINVGKFPTPVPKFETAACTLTAQEVEEQQMEFLLTENEGDGKAKRNFVGKMEGNTENMFVIMREGDSFVLSPIESAFRFRIDNGFASQENPEAVGWDAVESYLRKAPSKEASDDETDRAKILTMSSSQGADFDGARSDDEVEAADTEANTAERAKDMRQAIGPGILEKEEEQEEQEQHAERMRQLLAENNGDKDDDDDDDDDHDHDDTVMRDSLSLSRKRARSDDGEDTVKREEGVKIEVTFTCMERILRENGGEMQVKHLLKIFHEHLVDENSKMIFRRFIETRCFTISGMQGTKLVKLKE